MASAKEAAPGAAANPLYIFGSHSGRPWNSSQWMSVDDRVRGGKSASHLDISDPAARALFHGTLDITALGGAGFASQKTVPGLFGPSDLDMSHYDALVLDVDDGNDDETTTTGGSTVTAYTLTLKDTPALPRRPDGREQSTVSWEHDFRLGGGRASVLLRFCNFAPTYRGRPEPDAEPLNLVRILSLSIMARSHFGEQQGNFSLGLRSISAQIRADESGETTTQHRS